MASQAEPAVWLAVGSLVERELDDFANIWAAATVTAVRPGGQSVDLEYEDGCTEADVPAEELRPRAVAAAPEAEEVQAQAPEGAAPSGPQACPGGGELVEARPKRQGGLTASLLQLRSESGRLTETLSGLSSAVPQALLRLGAVSQALLHSASGLQSTVQVLGQLARGLLAARPSEPAFTDLAAAGSKERRAQQRRGEPTYMLPVSPKQRSALPDVAVSPSLGKSSSATFVGSPGRSLLRRRPESRGDAQQPSAMLLDLGVESAATPHGPAASGLAPARFSVAKKPHGSSSTSSLHLMLPPLQKTPQQHPLLSADARGLGAQWRRRSGAGVLI